MKKLTLIILAIILGACSSNTETDIRYVEGTKCDNVGKKTSCFIEEECKGIQVCETDNYWGECVCAPGSFNSGGESGEGSGGDGSEEATGGSENTGGEESTGGSENTGGATTGGEPSTGGFEGDTGGRDIGTGGEDMGTGGSGGGNVCVPKTCDEITVELVEEFQSSLASEDPLLKTDSKQGEQGSACGNHDDGCGGTIACDSCNGDGFSCGGARNTRLDRLFDINATTYYEPIAGICAGGCIEQSIDWIDYIHQQQGIEICQGQPTDFLYTCNENDELITSIEMTNNIECNRNEGPFIISGTYIYIYCCN